MVNIKIDKYILEKRRHLQQELLVRGQRSKNEPARKLKKADGVVGRMCKCVNKGQMNDRNV